MICTHWRVGSWLSPDRIVSIFLAPQLSNVINLPDDRRYELKPAKARSVLSDFVGIIEYLPSSIPVETRMMEGTTTGEIGRKRRGERSGILARFSIESTTRTGIMRWSRIIIAACRWGYNRDIACTWTRVCIYIEIRSSLELRGLLQVKKEKYESCDTIFFLMMNNFNTLVGNCWIIVHVKCIRMYIFINLLIFVQVFILIATHRIYD